MAAFGDAEWLQVHLRDSRRRFQKRMQRLFAKYDRPHEDSPLVHMSTLTYETPQGLRIWGGQLVDRSGGQHQEPPQKAEGRKDGQQGAAAASPTGAEAEGGGETTSHQEGLTLAVPRSPLKNELRQKYLAQVELLLQDQGHAQGADSEEDQDVQGSWDPVLFSFLRPPVGSGSHGSDSTSKALVPLPSATRGCPSSPACLAASVPRDVSFRAAADTSSSRSLEDVDLCEVTISDLYVGMLHCMSQLLSTRPACIISTKTSILQNWRLRCRARARARMNRTCCRARRARTHNPSDAPGPTAEPGRRVLRGLENLQTSGVRAGLRLEKGLLAVSPGQCAAWREPRGTEPKCPPLTYTGTSEGCSPDPENQLLKLKWLVSPMKSAARLQPLPRQRGTRYQEIGRRFAELHQEYCPGPRAQPSLAALPGTLVTSPALNACRSPTAFMDAFKGAIGSPVGAARCLSLAPPAPSRGLPAPAPASPDSLLPLVPSPGASRVAESPSRARFREIKETFSRLHRELCSDAPAWAAAGPHSGPQGAPQRGGPPEPSSLRLRHVTSAEAQPTAQCVRSARGDPEFPVKRCRLSAPPLCGVPATPQGSPRPVKEVGSQQPDDKRDERKRKEQRVFQDGRVVSCWEEMES